MKLIVAICFVFCAIQVAYTQNFGQELSNINFKNIIGGPLQAVITAQALSSKTTTDFINDVGLIDDNGRKTIRMVSFDYSKYDSDTSSLQNYSLSIPFIMLLPIPYLEVSTITIDLNVKLNSVQSTSTGSTFSTYGEVSSDWNWFIGSVNYNAGFSTTSSSAYTGTTERAYDLSVHVQAGQADMPSGAQRVLDMLEATIREIPFNGTFSN